MFLFERAVLMLKLLYDTMGLLAFLLGFEQLACQLVIFTLDFLELFGGI